MNQNNCTTWCGRQLEGLNPKKAVRNGSKRITRIIPSTRRPRGPGLNELPRSRVAHETCYGRKREKDTRSYCRNKSSRRVILFMSESWLPASAAICRNDDISINPPICQPLFSRPDDRELVFDVTTYCTVASRAIATRVLASRTILF